MRLNQLFEEVTTTFGQYATKLEAGMTKQELVDQHSMGLEYALELRKANKPQPVMDKWGKTFISGFKQGWNS